MKEKKLNSAIVRKSKQYQLLYIHVLYNKKNIDQFSNLYNFEGSFKLLHANIAYIRFVAKSEVFPKHGLLLVHFFPLKIHMYLIKNRGPLSRKLAFLYEDISEQKN